jgi:hypothetical protein
MASAIRGLRHARGIKNYKNSNISGRSLLYTGRGWKVKNEIPVQEVYRMALAFYFASKTPMSAQQYDECTKLLKKAGAGHPRGRVYHACFGSPESLAVFDVWTSQAAFEKFGKTLLPIMKQIGIGPVEPAVMAIHNVIAPPAKKPAAKKSAPKKRAAAPKSTARRKAGKKR